MKIWKKTLFQFQENENMSLLDLSLFLTAMKTEPWISCIQWLVCLTAVPFNVKQLRDYVESHFNASGNDLSRSVYQNPPYALSVTVCHVSAMDTYQSCISHTCNGAQDRLETTTSNFWIYAGPHVVSGAQTSWVKVGKGRSTQVEHRGSTRKWSKGNPLRSTTQYLLLLFVCVDHKM